MKFSLFVHMERLDASQSHAQLYEEFCRLCEIADQGGMGLRIMHYRAGLIGATLRRAPTKGGGLTITCDFRSHTPTP